MESGTLILTRKIDESIRIGDEVILKVLQVKGNQVRIGVTAPFEVCVHREEINRKIQANQPQTQNDLTTSHKDSS